MKKKRKKSKEEWCQLKPIANDLHLPAGTIPGIFSNKRNYYSITAFQNSASGEIKIYRREIAEQIGTYKILEYLNHLSN